MKSLTEIILAAILLTNITMVASSRLMRCIKDIAVQGILIGLLPLAVTDWTAGFPAGSIILASSLNLVVKGILLPYLLAFVVRRVGVKREIEPFVGYSASVAIIFLLTALSFLVTSCFNLAEGIISNIAVPAAFATICTGLFMIIARRKAITQVIGFLMFENGIAMFGTSIMLEYGLIMELGILQDIFVLVFIMGIAFFHIKKECAHIDADQLNKLGDKPTEGI